MDFKDKLKELREQRGLTQNKLGEICGITGRSIQNYELGVRTPKNMLTVKKLAEALGVTTDQLLGDDGLMLVEASEKYGVRGAKQAKELLSEVTGLFAGGEMSEADMDEMMRAMQEAYWDAKEKNKKYTPKKFRK